VRPAGIGIADFAAFVGGAGRPAALVLRPQEREPRDGISGSRPEIRRHLRHLRFFFFFLFYTRFQIANKADKDNIGPVLLLSITGKMWYSAPNWETV
jgi:hypothetical protein